MRELATRERLWSDEGIQTDFEKTLVTSDLSNLKAYLLNGVTMKVIENKVVVTNEPPSPEDHDAEQGNEIKLSHS